MRRNPIGHRSNSRKGTSTVARPLIVLKMYVRTAAQLASTEQQWRGGYTEPRPGEAAVGFSDRVERCSTKIHSTA